MCYFLQRDDLEPKYLSNRCGPNLPKNPILLNSWIIVVFRVSVGLTSHGFLVKNCSGALDPWPNGLPLTARPMEGLSSRHRGWRRDLKVSSNPDRFDCFCFICHLFFGWKAKPVGSLFVWCFWCVYSVENHRLKPSFFVCVPEISCSYAVGPHVSVYHSSCTDVVARLFKVNPGQLRLSDRILCWVVAFFRNECSPPFSQKKTINSLFNFQFGFACALQCFFWVNFQQSICCHLKSGCWMSVLVWLGSQCENMLGDSMVYWQWTALWKSFGIFSLGACLKILNTSVFFPTFHDFGINIWHRMAFSSELVDQGFYDLGLLCTVQKTARPGPTRAVERSQKPTHRALDVSCRQSHMHPQNTPHKYRNHSVLRLNTQRLDLFPSSQCCE